MDDLFKRLSNTLQKQNDHAYYFQHPASISSLTSNYSWNPHDPSCFVKVSESYQLLTLFQARLRFHCCYPKSCENFSEHAGFVCFDWELRQYKAGYSRSWSSLSPISPTVIEYWDDILRFKYIQEGNECILCALQSYKAQLKCRAPDQKGIQLDQLSYSRCHSPDIPAQSLSLFPDEVTADLPGILRADSTFWPTIVVPIVPGRYLTTHLAGFWCLVDFPQTKSAVLSK